MILLGASFDKAGRSEREVRILAALRHLMYKDHELMPSGCDGCLDICAWLTVPGYAGERGGPV